MSCIVAAVRRGFTCVTVLITGAIALRIVAMSDCIRLPFFPPSSCATLSAGFIINN